MVTIWVIGDSTAQDYTDYPQLYPLSGWAQFLSVDHFDNNRISVEDRAISGESSKSFLEGRSGNPGLWDGIYRRIQPGDFVVIQFAHNDKQEDDDERSTDPRTTYKGYLNQYAQDTIKKRAKPIFVTPICRNSWSGQTLLNTHDDYPSAMRELASELNVDIVDMEALSRIAFEAMGPSGTPDIFLHLDPGEYPGYPDGITDNTHFQETGARFLAELFISDAQEQGLPFVYYLNTNWNSYRTCSTRMTVPRTQIRHYIAAMLKTHVDVGNRVFTNRRSILFNTELPAVCIEYGAENNEVIDGDKRHARSYERELSISIIIGVEDVLASGQDLLQNADGQDYLDVLGQQVEDAIGEDYRLAKMLDGYDPNTNYSGLISGMRIIGGDTYEPDSNTDRNIIFREIGIIVYYDTQTFRDLRLNEFEEMGFEFSWSDEESVEHYAMTMTGSGERAIILRGSDGSFVRVLWGDGESTVHMLLGESTNVVYSHTYNSDTDHNIYIQEFIPGAEDTGSYIMVISGNGERIITLRGTNGLVVRIYWGDGEYTTHTLLGSSTDVVYSHTYSTSGDYMIYLREL